MTYKNKPTCFNWEETAKI